jgi:hypothetical protein
VARHLSAAVLIAVSAALLGFSLANIRSELAAWSNRPDAARFAAIASGAMTPGTSLFAKDRYFSDCLDLPDGLYARAQPSNRRTAFLAACANAARSVTAAMPTYARAWLALAATDIDALGWARATAPEVAWLADRRLILTLRHGIEPKSDIAVLLTSAAGTHALAAHYIAMPHKRELFLSVAERASPDQQRRFLSAIKAAAP